MPGGDRTGPMGQGPMTGRGAGYCAGYGNAGLVGGGFGRRYGRGFGCGAGRGWPNRFFATGLPGWTQTAGGYQSAPLSKVEEADMLRFQSEQLQNELRQIGQRLSELESKQ